jgi:hypothetical protein
MAMKSVLLLLLSAMYSKDTVTDFVNTVEPLLAANRDAYLSGPHTLARQQSALQFFDQQWAWLKSPQACGSHALGNAGQTCLADRARNGAWPWEAYYRDPIVNGHF